MPVWTFYPKRAWEIASKHVRMIRHWLMLDRLRRNVRNDPERHRYTDAALAPVEDNDTEVLEMFTHTESARDEVVRTRKIHELTHGAGKSAAHAEA